MRGEEEALLSNVTNHERGGPAIKERRNLSILRRKGKGGKGKSIFRRHDHINRLNFLGGRKGMNFGVWPFTKIMANKGRGTYMTRRANEGGPHPRGERGKGGKTKGSSF